MYHAKRATLFHAMPCCIRLCYAMLHYAILCCTIPHVCFSIIGMSENIWTVCPTYIERKNDKI